MSPAGRPRKPKAIRELEGNRSKTEIPPEPDYPVLDLPSPPKDIGKEGRAEWLRLAPMLVAQGVLTAADWSAFELYCRTLSACHEAYRNMRACGQRDLDGKMTDALKVYWQFSREVRSHQAALGLTPTTRSRVGFVKADAESGEDIPDDILNS